MMLGSKILKGYIALTLGILAVVSFIILSGIGIQINMEFIVLDILIILLIGATLFSSIIQLNILEELEESNGKRED